MRVEDRKKGKMSTDVHRLTSLHAVPIICRTREGVLEHKQMNRAEE